MESHHIARTYQLKEQLNSSCCFVFCQPVSRNSNPFTAAAATTIYPEARRAIQYVFIMGEKEQRQTKAMLLLIT